MFEKRNQTSEILAYMEKHEDGITSKVAFKKFGATRLSSIIFELRKKGIGITSTKEVVKDRYGHSKQIARYKLAK